MGQALLFCLILIFCTPQENIYEFSAFVKYPRVPQRGCESRPGSGPAWPSGSKSPPCSHVESDNHWDKTKLSRATFSICTFKMKLYIIQKFMNNLRYFIQYFSNLFGFCVSVCTSCHDGVRASAWHHNTKCFVPRYNFTLGEASASRETAGWIMVHSA